MDKETRHRLHVLLEQWRRRPVRCPDVESGRREYCPELQSADTKGINPWHSGCAAGARACADDLLAFLEDDAGR